MDLKVLGIFLLPLIFRYGSSQDETSTNTPEPEYVWKHYPKEAFPLVKKAFMDIASSESKIAIFYHYFGSPAIPGLQYTGTLDYSHIPGPDFYYDWTTKSADDTTVSEQGADESLYTTVSEQGADVSLYTTVSEQGADESLYTTVSEQGADESLYTTVAEQGAEESLYTTVAEQGAEESLYTTVEDQLSTIIQQRLGLMFEELPELSEEIEFGDEMSKRSDEYVEEAPLQVGSIRGIPGEHFPDYYDIPITSFSCADKKYIPGFYADLETGCQVFHVCWPHRRESFLCPVGTTFNQAFLTCDYWYSTNCSLAPLFFDVNSKAPEAETSSTHTSPMIDELVKNKKHATPATEEYVSYQPETSESSDTPVSELDWSRILKFLPVKSKIVLYPESTASKVVIKHSSLKPRRVVQDQESENVKRKVKVQKLDPNEVLEIVKSAIAAQKMKPENGLNLESLPKKEHVYVEVPVVKTGKRLAPLPTINPKFVVKPQVFKRPIHNVPRKANVGTVESVVQKVIPATKMLPAKILKTKPLTKVQDEKIKAIVMRGLEMAGSVIQNNILPLTQKVVASSIKIHEDKKM